MPTVGLRRQELIGEQVRGWRGPRTPPRPRSVHSPRCRI